MANKPTVRHATNQRNRSINRETQKMQGYNITLTTNQVQEAIKLKFATYRVLTN